VAETRVVLIRHGETHWNREGRIQGFHGDSPLTPAGREQVRSLGERMAREEVELLYSSDSVRARETADPIAAATGLQVVHDRELRERAYGIFEGCRYAEVEGRFAAEFERFRSRDPHYVPPGGESAAQFRDRILAAFRRIALGATGRCAAVVTHGGVLGILYREAMGMPLEAPRNYPIANASLNRLRFAEGRWSLDGWGDVAHLRAESPAEK
jgi:2,3-bisphosphoglycerate-dependent phosphoglycerate mutase